MNIIVSGAANSNSKVLKINVGSIPIITSSTEVSSQVNSQFSYTITSDNADATYSVIGSLNKGLSFKGNLISGKPTVVGLNTVTLKAKNSFGESTTSLSITIYKNINE